MAFWLRTDIALDLRAGVDNPGFTRHLYLMIHTRSLDSHHIIVVIRQLSLL